MSDFNFDGLIDLFVANGHIDPRYADGEGYEMTPQLFSFDGSRWQEARELAGEYFTQKYVGRGVASADYDRDGDTDLCVVHQNQPLALLQNESVLGQGLTVQLIGRSSNRNAFGAKVRIVYNGQEQSLELAGGTSYAASHERAVRFGLGAWNGPCRVEVQWPSGQSETTEIPQINPHLTILEGHGAIAMASSSPPSRPSLP